MLAASILLLTGLLLHSVIQLSAATANQSDVDVGIRVFKTRLYEDLIANYGPTTSRPVKNESLPVFVKFRLLVDHLVDFDEPKQQISLFCSIKTVWKDEYLTWNETNYGGLKSMEVDVSQIWYPDITLLTSTTSDYLTLDTRRVFVSSAGEVTWLSPAIIRSMCVLDVVLFPFDRQNCTFSFGSFASPSNLIDLDFFFEHNVTTRDRYHNNGVWEIVGDNVFRVLETYSSAEQAFAEVHYHITFGRLSKVYLLTIIFPSVLLSFSTLLIFVLPPDSGEKISLGITNLLAMVVFQELVFSAMPPSGSPAIANNICIMVLISCLAILFASVSQRMHSYGDNRDVPRWLYRILISDCDGPDNGDLYGDPNKKSKSKSRGEKGRFSTTEVTATGNGHEKRNYDSASTENEVDVEQVHGIESDDRGPRVKRNNRSKCTERIPTPSSTSGATGKELPGQGHRVNDRGSVASSLLYNEGDYDDEDDDDGVGGRKSRHHNLRNGEIWTKLSIAFEKKAAIFLLCFIILSILVTVLEMVIYCLHYR